MSLKFQYNKTSLQALEKQLNIREKALPTLKNKESALRMEVKIAKQKNQKLIDKINRLIREEDNNLRMWKEFDSSLVSVRDIKLKYRKIAGVSVAEAEEVSFDVEEYDLFNSPKWFPDGIKTLKDMTRMSIERELLEKQQALLEYARKKTTQKVNLYEKVQIPAHEDAIRKIKRYLEDEDNLAKAAQKIVKARQQNSQEAIS